MFYVVSLSPKLRSFLLYYQTISSIWIFYFPVKWNAKKKNK